VSLHRQTRTDPPSPVARRRHVRRRNRWLSCAAGVTALAALVVMLTSLGNMGSADATTISMANPSLETDADSNHVPDCWQPQGSGKNRYSFTWTTAAHSGSRAEQVTITSYRSGVRGLFVQMGSSGCGPAVVPGHQYTLSGWYLTGGQAHLTAFYRDTSGTWVRWTSGPTLPVASGWTQAEYVTPDVPANATAISFGIELQSAGSLTTDDYALSDSGSPTPSPTASATSSPTAGATSSPTATATSSPTASATSSPTATATSPAPSSSASTSPSPTPTSSTSSATSSAPPPASGYFTTLVPPGNVASLQSGSACADAVHRSTWEPRPDNYKRDHHVVDAAAVHRSFAERPRSGLGTYDPRWDSWLLPRVDGQFSGTTDEIIQWAACKWGLPDNYLRAEAYTESTWFQYETYPSGRCADQYGCGDWFSSEPYTARKTFCSGLASSGGYDYQKDYGDGLCPKTFSIVGSMSWWNPSWGFNWAGNQNGTFPYTRDSTAMALDYMASQVRGCYEGWQWELGSNYSAGDLWGCAGAWYSGVWHDSRAETYISTVQGHQSAKPWLTAYFATQKPSCSTTYGCPGPDPLP
jgi:hypothetical protein